MLLAEWEDLRTKSYLQRAAHQREIEEAGAKTKYLLVKCCWFCLRCSQRAYGRVRKPTYSWAPFCSLVKCALSCWLQKVWNELSDETAALSFFSGGNETEIHHGPCTARVGCGSAMVKNEEFGCGECVRRSAPTRSTCKRSSTRA